MQQIKKVSISTFAFPFMVENTDLSIFPEIEVDSLYHAIDVNNTDDVEFDVNFSSLMRDDNEWHHCK